VVSGSFIGLIAFDYHNEPRSMAGPLPAAIRSQAHSGPFRDLFTDNGAEVRHFSTRECFVALARCFSCHQKVNRIIRKYRDHAGCMRFRIRRGWWLLPQASLDLQVTSGRDGAVLGT
jgi:hypothetical protein